MSYDSKRSLAWPIALLCAFAAGCDDGDVQIRDPKPAPLLCSAPAPDSCEACACSECADALAVCKGMEGVASEGPAAGKAKSALCAEMVRCVVQTQCQEQACLCGDADFLGGACLAPGGAHGPCRDAMFAAAETTDIQTFVLRTLEATEEVPLPPSLERVGAYAIHALRQVMACTANTCGSACREP